MLLNLTSISYSQMNQKSSIILRINEKFSKENPAVWRGCLLYNVILNANILGCIKSGGYNDITSSKSAFVLFNMTPRFAAFITSTACSVMELHSATNFRDCLNFVFLLSLFGVLSSLQS